MISTLFALLMCLTVNAAEIDFNAWMNRKSPDMEITAKHTFDKTGKTLFLDRDNADAMLKTHYLVVRFDVIEGMSIDDFNPVTTFRNLVDRKDEGACWKYVYDLDPEVKARDGKAEMREKAMRRRPPRIALFIRNWTQLKDKDRMIDIKGTTFWFLDPGPVVWVPKNAD